MSYQGRGNYGRNDRNGGNDRNGRDGDNDGYSRKQMHYSPNLLSSINNAIDNQRMVSLEYDSREKGITLRDAEPMAVVYKHGKRHLVGFCHLRSEYRSFRLDRISTLRVNGAQFTRREDFDLEKIESQMDLENASRQHEEEDDYEEPEN